MSTATYITIGILHFNEECIIIHKMIVVGNNIGMVEERQNINLILCILANFVTEHAQVHLFPYNQAVVLEQRHNITGGIKEVDDDDGVSFFMLYH